MKNLNSKSSIKELKFDIPICHEANPINTLELSSIFREDVQNKYGSDYINKLMNLNIHSSGFLTGSIDQVFADNPNHEIAKWWVLDWKSNWIGSPLSKEMVLLVVHQIIQFPEWMKKCTIITIHYKPIYIYLLYIDF